MRLRHAVIAGLALLATIFYFGRGQRADPQPPSGDRARPAAVIDGTDAGATEATARGEQVALDATRPPSVADPPVESIDRLTTSVGERTDPDRPVAGGTETAVEDTGTNLTTDAGSRPVEPDTARTEVAPVAVAPREGNYAIQVAAFNQRGPATALAGRLTDAGYPAYVIEAPPRAERTVFRVRIGTYLDRQAAEAVGRRVRDEQALDWYLVTRR